MADQFETILPLAAKWTSEQEQLILRQGSPLSVRQIADARAAGIAEPERVRVLLVEEIPSPSDPVLKAAAEQVTLLPKAPSGLTMRYGVFIRRGCENDRHLLVHELVHTSQYERLGGIVPFLRDYLTECASFGYHNAPLEQQAEEIASQVCAA